MRVTKYFLESIYAAMIAVGEGLVPASIQDSVSFDIQPSAIVQMVPRPVYGGDTVTEAYDEYRKEFARYTTTTDSRSTRFQDMPVATSRPMPIMHLTLDRRS